MRSCPRCGRQTDRVALPFLLRPLRILLPTLRRVRCSACGWRGLQRR